MAQSGSASALGAEGRGFESLCPDHMHLVLSGDLGRPLLPAHNGNIPTKSYIIRAHFRLRFADPSTGLKRNTIGAISTCFKSARSSTGQSTGLLSRRLQVRFLPGAPPPRVYDDGGRSSVGRAPDCDSGRRGFESRRPPHFRCRERRRAVCLRGYSLGPLAQLVEQLTLNQLVVGSIPTRPTNSTT